MSSHNMKEENSVQRVMSVVVFTLLFLVGQETVTVGQEEAGRRPNILFLLTDDQRYDSLGCMGNPIIQTPNVDRLASQGTLFTNAFCTTSICSISRASYLTGQYANRHGIIDFATMLSDDAFAETFAAQLRKHGYRTGFLGKWGVGRDLPAEQYDFWGGFPGQGRYFEPGRDKHMTRHLGDLALEFLDGCSKDQPFCLQISFKAAHCQDGEPWPFQPDPKYQSLYQNAEIQRPVTEQRSSGLKPGEAFARLPAFLQTSEARNRWFVRFANNALYQKSVKDYYRLISGVDGILGELREKLHQKGLADDTVIIFTSDNGFYLGEHGLAGKWFTHEESIRLPMVVYDPRLSSEKRGRKCDQIALNIDMAPTILDYARVAIPERMQGKSLRPLIEGECTDWRTDFFYEHRLKHPKLPQSEAVRDSRWKYVEYLVDPVHVQLFDLQNDPHELRNLADDPQYADQLSQMRSRLQQLRSETK